MSMVGANPWFVVQTQVNAEAKAARNLLQQGFEIYLPRYLKRRSHARKVDKVAAPLFPRYLFVQVDMATQRWRSIQSTFGVASLVFNGVGTCAGAAAGSSLAEGARRRKRLCQT